MQHEKIDFSQTPAAIKKDEAAQKENSSAQRQKSSKKLSERNRNHLRRKLMAKANDLIVKKQEKSVEAEPAKRESSATVKLKKPTAIQTIQTRNGNSVSLKMRPTASYMTPVNNTQRIGSN